MNAETHKPKIIRLVAVFLSIIMLVICFPGCDTPNDTDLPLLPYGLLQLIIPELRADTAQIWLGSDVSLVGGSVNFTNESDASKIFALIDTLPISIWKLQNGKTIYAASDEPSSWLETLKTALSQQKMINPAARYPEAVTDFYYFPSSPPDKPFAAGFIDLSTRLATSIGENFGLSLEDYLSALKSARISSLALVAYSAKTFTPLPTDISETYINNLQLSLLGVARSAYPSVVLSLFFDKAMTDGGFTKYNAADVTIYDLKIENITILVARLGSVIYAAAAQDRGNAERLLLSCLR